MTYNNFRISVTSGISGHFAIMVVNVVEDFGEYQDIYQTGIGRYRTRAEAVREARSWAEAEELACEV